MTLRVAPRGETPIGDYALLGDTRTAALTSPEGSIDWLCLARFDGEPIFGSLIGGEEAGRFLVAPIDTSGPPQQTYRPGSPVLETTWPSPGSRVTLTEGMVAENRHDLLPTTLLVRRVECRGAPVDVTVLFDPRRGKTHQRPRAARHGGALVCTWGGLAVGISTDPDATLVPGRPERIRVTEGHPLTITMAVADREPLVQVDAGTAWNALQRDDQGWRSWISETDNAGPFDDAIKRSLITLRLLTYSPSGAPVAAPTTSLPEQAGSARTWDYRYAWPRDASLGVSAFLGAGRDEQARAFLFWLLHASRLQRPQLPPVLTLLGKPVPDEHELEDWPGYSNSQPVRVGNDAGSQHQLDTYGWVLNAGWELTKAGHGLYGETWRALTGFADLVARRWHQPDAGIWEQRADPAHHVHSKLMAWVALDRASRIAEHLGARRHRQQRWHDQKTAIAANILRNGYDRERDTFVGAYGHRDLDAALLAPPLTEIADILGPGLTGTINALQRELSPETPFVYRYPTGSDGLDGSEGAFLPCSFWMVDALARTARVDEATEWFEQLLEMGGGLGLFAEEVDPDAGLQLGNYPQALTHSSLVSAGLAIRNAIDIPAHSDVARTA
jgi:GH15 family glucan-1,4-alpha-glucosidase